MGTALWMLLSNRVNVSQISPGSCIKLTPEDQAPEASCIKACLNKLVVSLSNNEMGVVCFESSLSGGISETCSVEHGLQYRHRGMVLLRMNGLF